MCVLLASASFEARGLTPFHVIHGNVEELFNDEGKSWALVPSQPRAAISITLTEEAPCGLIELRPDWSSSEETSNSIQIGDWSLYFLCEGTSHNLVFFKEDQQADARTIAVRDDKDVILTFKFAAKEGTCAVRFEGSTLFEVTSSDAKKVPISLLGARDTTSYLKRCQVGSCERWIIVDEDPVSHEIGDGSDRSRVAGGEDAKQSQDYFRAQNADLIRLPNKKGSHAGSIEAKRGPWITLTKIGAMDVSK